MPCCQIVSKHQFGVGHLRQKSSVCSFMQSTVGYYFIFSQRSALLCVYAWMVVELITPGIR
jgi:hypothetical protein